MAVRRERGISGNRISFSSRSGLDLGERHFLMALTLDAEQRLERAGLITFFADHRDTWLRAATDAHEYLGGSFPPGSTVRPDDVSKVLAPIIEVNERLRNRLAERKMTQKYWTRYFVDLIIDRTWDEIHGG